MPTKKELLRKLAALESMNDQLVSEIDYIDQLMRDIGFSEGLKSVKETAVEIIEEKHNHMPDQKSEDF